MPESAVASGVGALHLDTQKVQLLRDRLLASGSSRETVVSTPSVDLSADQRAAIERIGPLVEVLFLVMSADDERARSESESIRRAVHVLSDDILPDAEIDRLLAGMEAALEREGPDARLEALASRFALDRADAEVAFTLAAAIALADGRVDEAETALVDEMRRYFGIRPDRAQALLEGAPAGR